MEINIQPNTHFIFDLDDTLADEQEFVYSGFRHISETIYPHTGKQLHGKMIWLYDSKKNVFDWLVSEYAQVAPHLTKDYLIALYRGHFPKISIRRDAERFLKTIAGHRIKSGLITDGRATTQRNKLKALNLEGYFSDVIISEEFGTEKPHPSNFQYFVDKYPEHQFVFFGDNTIKDFIVPLKFGWTCICLKDNGKNIHPQHFNTELKELHVVSSFDEITLRKTKTVTTH